MSWRPFLVLILQVACLMRTCNALQTFYSEDSVGATTTVGQSTGVSFCVTFTAKCCSAQGSRQYMSFVNFGKDAATTSTHSVVTYRFNDLTRFWEKPSGTLGSTPLLPGGASGGRVSHAEVFDIAGITYIAVALYVNNVGLTFINSKIYEFTMSASDYTWAIKQNIPTYGAMCFEYFVIGTTSYLAVANQYDSTIPTWGPSSPIRSWDGTNFGVTLQNIVGQGASDWDFFVDSGSNYLLLANKRDVAGNNVNSQLYKWNGITFVLWQNIPTVGAVRWDVVSFGGATYAMVVNGGSPGSWMETSYVYKYNPALTVTNPAAVTGGFASFQNILTIGGSGTAFVVIKAQLYLAVSNFYIDNAGSTGVSTTVIHKMTSSTSFTPFQTIATSGAKAVTFFKRGSTHYLVISEAGDSSAPFASDVYRFVGISRTLTNSKSTLTFTNSDYKSFTQSVTRDKSADLTITPNETLTKTIKYTADITEDMTASGTQTLTNTDEYSSSFSRMNTEDQTDEKTFSQSETWWEMTLSRTIKTHTLTFSDTETWGPSMTLSETLSLLETRSQSNEGSFDEISPSISPTISETVDETLSFTLTLTIKPHSPTKSHENSVEPGKTTPTRTRRSRTKTFTRDRSVTESQDVSVTTTETISLSHESTHSYRYSLSTHSKTPTKFRSDTRTGSDTETPSLTESDPFPWSATPSLSLSADSSVSSTESPTMSDTEPYGLTPTDSMRGSFTKKRSATVSDLTRQKTQKSRSMLTKETDPTGTKPLTPTLSMMDLTGSSSVSDTVSPRHGQISGSLPALSGEQLADFAYVPRVAFVLQIDGDWWGPNAKTALFAAMESTLPNMTNGFTSERDAIEATSKFEINAQRTEVRITLGYSKSYMPPTGESIYFAKRVGPALKNQWNIEPVFVPLSMNLVPVSKPLDITVPSESAILAGSIVAIVFSAANLDAVTTVQTLAILGQMGCSDPGLRKSARQASWTISLLHVFFGDINGLGRRASMATWNVITLGVVYFVQMMVKTRLSRNTHWSEGTAAAKALYPHLTVMAFVFLLPVTASMSVGGLYENTASMVVCGVHLAAMVIVIGLCVKWLKFKNQSSQLTWHDYPVQTFPASFMFVRGVWRPIKTRKRLGALFKESVSGLFVYFPLAQMIALFLIGVVSGIQVTDQSDCNILDIVLMVLFGGVCLGCFAMPLRSRFLSILEGIVYLLQTFLVLLIFLKSQSMILPVGVAAMWVGVVKAIASILVMMHEKWYLKDTIDNDDGLERAKTQQIIMTKETQAWSNRAPDSGAPIFFSPRASDGGALKAINEKWLQSPESFATPTRRPEVPVQNPLNNARNGAPVPGDAGYDFVVAVAGGMAVDPRHVPIGVSVVSSRPWNYSQRLSAVKKTDNEREMDDLKFVL